MADEGGWSHDRPKAEWAADLDGDLIAAIDLRAHEFEDTGTQRAWLQRQEALIARFGRERYFHGLAHLLAILHMDLAVAQETVEKVRDAILGYDDELSDDDDDEPKADAASG